MEIPASKINDVRPHADRLNANIARVHNLVSIYQTIAGSHPGRKSVGDTDVLRAAVVLLHASLEDFLRSLSRELFPLARQEVMDTIPLAGTGTAGRPEKVLLGQLRQHRGKSVDELIEQSIEAHLERSNYNNSKEVAGLLDRLDLPVEPVRRFLSDLDKMMARRHQIVHRADCTSQGGRGRHVARSLRVASVEKWINTVLNFHGVILYQLHLKAVQDE